MTLLRALAPGRRGWTNRCSGPGRAGLLLMLVGVAMLLHGLQTAQVEPPDIGLAANPAPGEVTQSLHKFGP